MMVFNKQILKEMKEEIESFTKMSWDKAIISTIDNDEQSCFAEYETYGNYMLEKYSDKMNIKPFYNKALQVQELTGLKELNDKYSKHYNSVSFHSYTK